jgi:hypothetical protein
MHAAVIGKDTATISTNGGQAQDDLTASAGIPADRRRRCQGADPRLLPERPIAGGTPVLRQSTDAFWPITSELFGFEPNASYARRLAALRSRGAALWELLHQCRRAGSADSAIDPKSLVVNHFAELFANYPTIARVYFNGAKAAEL